jgi:hypothetical protein
VQNHNSEYRNLSFHYYENLRSVCNLAASLWYEHMNRITKGLQQRASKD